MWKKLAVGVGAIAILIVVWWSRGKSHDAAAPQASKAASAQAVSRKNAPATPASLSGRVTRKDTGAPIAGANIAVAAAAFDPNQSNSNAPSTVVTSDANGGWTAPKLAPGAYVIAASALGFIPVAREKLAVGAGEQRGGIDFALAPGGTSLHGTVSDVTGGPIAGARITAVRDESIQLMFGHADFVTMSGPDGKYELTLPDGEFHITATHDDYTRGSKRVEIAGKPVTADFVLTPGGRIHGQVVARDTGKPVPRARVNGHLRRGGGSEAYADDDGKFMLERLPPGAIQITAAGHGYASNAPSIVELGIGEQLEGVRVVVDRAFSISGRVVKKGQPDHGIANVFVAVFSLSGGGEAQTLEPSDATGAFEIVGVKAGSYMIAAIGEDIVPEFGKPVEVVDKDVKDLTVEMSAGVTLSGRVDPPGVATITLGHVGDVGIGNIFEMIKLAFVRTDSDAAGAFVLHNVPAGKFDLRAATREGPAGKLPIEIGDVDQKGLVIALETRASIAGRVIDTNGAPVADTRVQAKAADRNAMTMVFDGREDGSRTAADGTFKVVGLEPGKYSVETAQLEDMFEIAKKDKKDKRADRADVDLAAGAAVTGITLTVEARDGVIRGQVIGSDGKPAADAWVSVRRALPDKMKTFNFDGFDQRDPVLVNADGKFVIDKLRKGAYKVIADGARGGARAEKDGVNTGDSVTIALQPLGTLAGHVTERAAAVTTFDLTCRGPVGAIDRHITAEDGAYALEHLAPGSYDCSVSADSGTAQGKVEVPAGNATLDLRLVAWASLTGTVVSALNGRPVEGIQVVAGSDGNTKQLMNVMTGGGPTTDATGRFVVPQVANGQGFLVLFAKASGFQPLANQSYTAVAGQRTDLGPIKIVPPRTTDAGTFGMATDPTDSALAVTSVTPAGPAAQAGIVAGDKITAIDGRSVTDITPKIAQTVLGSGTVGIGQTVSLTLERGTTVSVTSIKW